MGKAITTTGVSFNFAGTSAPTSAQGMQFGENKEAFIEYGTAGGGTIVIEALDKNVAINVDSGTARISISSSGLLLLVGGAASMIRLTGAAGGTVAELNGSGNLRLAGTLGTGISF